MDLHMGSRKIARDRLDRLWRRWTTKDGHKWADYLKNKIANIDGVYALPMENANRLMNEAYRAGFAEGLREAKRLANEAHAQKAGEQRS